MEISVVPLRLFDLVLFHAAVLNWAWSAGVEKFVNVQSLNKQQFCESLHAKKYQEILA